MKAERVWPEVMLHEINEQPQALRRTLQYYAEGSRLRRGFHKMVAPALEKAELTMVASGSSRHAGLTGKIAIEDWAEMPVDVDYASEYRLRGGSRRRAATVVLSQSGEESDTLAALRLAKERGQCTVAVTNMPGSTIGELAAVNLPTLAGPELAGTATKSFTTQLAVVALLAIAAGQQRERLTEREAAALVDDLMLVPEMLERQLAGWEKSLAELASFYCQARTIRFAGRGVHYAVALEGALKLTETSSIHAEGYPTGELRLELKAPASPEVPLVVLATRDKRDLGSVLRYEHTVELLKQWKRQGATVLGLANTGDAVVRELTTHMVEVAPMREHLLPMAEVVPLQLLAYFVAMRDGMDVTAGA